MIANFFDIILMVVFIATYYKFNLIYATIVFSSIALLKVIYNLLIKKELNKFSTIIYLYLLLAAILGKYFESALFIKIKPTIINSAIVMVLIFDKFFQRNLVNKFLMTTLEKVNIKYQANGFNYNFFILFYLLLALLNELIWRNFNDTIWVYYKLFGNSILMTMPIILNIYRLSQPMKANMSSKL